MLLNTACPLSSFIVGAGGGRCLTAVTTPETSHLSLPSPSKGHGALPYYGERASQVPARAPWQPGAVLHRCQSSLVEGQGRSLDLSCSISLIAFQRLLWLKPLATAGNWSQWSDCISKLRPWQRVIARVVGQAAVVLLIFKPLSVAVPR